jgi:hypothetical protein
MLWSPRKTPAKAVKEVLTGEGGEIVKPVARKRKTAGDEPTAATKKQKTAVIVGGGSTGLC